jgi:F0F1-type ATP synthase membrane subunit b/b'
MPQLDSTLYASQLFWLGIVFAFIYLGVLYYFAPRFQHVFHVRTEKIEKKLELARTIKLEADTLEQESEQRLESLTEQARLLVHRAEVSFKEALSARQHALALIHSKVLSDAEKELKVLREDFLHSRAAEEDLTQRLFEQLTPFHMDREVYKEALRHAKDHPHVA